jgi:hypothetical protein
VYINKFNYAVHLTIVVLGEKCCLIFCYEYKQQLPENKKQVRETNSQSQENKETNKEGVKQIKGAEKGG